MQISKRRTRNTKCMLDNVKTERILTTPPYINANKGVSFSIDTNNHLLAKQNSEMKIRVALLEEKLNAINGELIESKFKCNSLREANSKLELQNKRLEKMGLYGTRYFEKLGRSTELMIEKFKSSLELEPNLNSSHLSTNLTLSLDFDSTAKREKRELTSIREEYLVVNSDENTPQIHKKQSRSRQLFTQNVLSDYDTIRENKWSFNSSVKKVNPENARRCTSLKSPYIPAKPQAISETDKENRDTPDVVAVKRTLRNVSKKNYVILPTNRKLRQGDDLLITVKPTVNYMTCSSELQMTI